MATIELEFKPGVSTQVTVDECNLLFYAAPCAAHRKPATVPDQVRVIQEALDNPIGSKKLGDLLQPDRSVVIVVDDFTRPTPAARILPPILDLIQDAGIPDEAVLVYMALGTHRPMTEQELRDKLGDGVLERYQVINRGYLEGDFVDLGTTESGTPVEINREILDADVKIAVGNVVPHVASGWGGGSKILLPGVCSKKTTDRMHLAACMAQPVLEVMGTRDNVARTEMDAIAEKVGLDFIVNTVMDEDQNLLGVYAGHYAEAHREAVALAETTMVIPTPAQADIVITSANPCYFDYWQGLKPYAFSHLAVREGGVIIFLLDGEEGLCGDAPLHEETVRKYLLWSLEDQKAAVARGEVDDLAGVQVPMYHSMLRHRVKRTLCVTNHMTQADLDDLAFDPAPDVQTALDMAYDLVGRDAKVGIIPFGGETLVKPADMT